MFCVFPHTLGAERRLRVFENGVPRMISGSKSDEVTGEWKKVRNEKLRDLHSAPNVIRVLK
jgi:hypothetical protein